MYTKRVGNWIMTATGGRFYPLDPQPEDFKIEDIAHALANTCRFTGHVEKFYSVGQHSILVSEAIEKQFPYDHELMKAGLIHDASEAYLVDVPSPLKPYLPEYKKIEANVMDKIQLAFGISDETMSKVKAFDTAILVDEMVALMPYVPDAWQNVERLGIEVEPLAPGEAKQQFLDRFDYLVSLRELATVTASL